MVEELSYQWFLEAIQSINIGFCIFVSDNHLKLDAQISLRSKKKSPCKKITGFEVFDSYIEVLHSSYLVASLLFSLFVEIYLLLCVWVSNYYHFLQFSPKDSNKVMVTCADSQVRILDGLNVIGKYRGMCFSYRP